MNWTNQSNMKKYLILAFLLILLIKSSLILLFNTPIIYYDEFAYGFGANELIEGNISLFNQFPLTHPYLNGYPALISPAYIFKPDMDLVYHAILFINCILSALLIFPVFYIMKMFVNEKLSLLTGILVCFLPVIMIHNYFIMSENAFYLFFLLSCYFTIRTFTCENFDKNLLFNALILGLCLGMLCFIKANGIFIVGSVFCIFIYKLIRERLKALKYSLVFIPFLPVLLYLFFNNLFYNNYSPNTYIDKIGLIFDDPWQFLSVIFNEINYFILMGYFVFFGFMVFLFLNYKVIRDKHFTVFALFSFLSIISLIFVTGLHLYITPYEIYTRYVSVGLPLVFMLGIIGIVLFNRIKDKFLKAELMIIFIISFLSVILFFPREPYNFINNLDIIWVMFLGIVFPIILVILFLFILCLKDHHFKKVNSIVIVAVVLSLIVFSPNLYIVKRFNDNSMYINFNGSARWFMDQDDNAVIVFDSDIAIYPFMDLNTKPCVESNLYFWLPDCEIIVLNLSCQDLVFCDYILTDKNLSFERLGTIRLNFDYPYFSELYIYRFKIQ